MSSPRSSFLVPAELEGSSLRPSFLGWKTECHLVASLNTMLLGLGCCFASVSWRWVKHNSDPTLVSPGCSKHSNLAGEFFVLRRFLDTKFIGLGFATAEPSSDVLS